MHISFQVITQMGLIYNYSMIGVKVKVDGVE